MDGSVVAVLPMQTRGDPDLAYVGRGLTALVRSDLEVPPSVTRGLSLYLLFSIGLHGGVELSHAGFGLATLALVVVTPIMVNNAIEIATLTGLSTGFVGTTLVALVTSLPELVTTISAGRIGAYDLAVGNLFGSNIFNIFTLALADLFFIRGRFLSRIPSALTMAGVGRVIIAHGGDMISPDLNRQILGSEAVIGKPRAPDFAAYLRTMNRFAEIEGIVGRVALGHQQSDDAIGPQGFRRQAHGNATVNTARQGNDQPAAVKVFR
mgnify:CR=1 FL=1